MSEGKEEKWSFSLIPEAKVFTPTLKEFSNPLKYISSIKDVAKTTGQYMMYHFCGFIACLALYMRNELVVIEITVLNP